MIIDEKKLKRQEGQVQEWIKQGCQGTQEAIPGYGKTYVAVLAIQRLHRKYPDVPVDVVVPSTPLYYDWVDPKNGHIKVHGLKNVEVFVINTYCKFGRRNPGLLIVDEIHKAGSTEFFKIFEVAGCVKKLERTKQDTYILGLTATLERLDGKHRLLQEYCPVFDTVTIEEGRKEGYVSNYKVYNWGLELNEEDRVEYDKWHNIFNNSFGKFNHNFDLAMACSKSTNWISEVEVVISKENQVTRQVEEVKVTMAKTTRDWIYWWSQQQEWDGEKDSFWSPSSISKYAQQFSTSMRNRKTFIYTASVKLEAAKALVDRYPVKTITFSESISFAERLKEALGDKCLAYHNDIKGRKERVEIISKRGLISYKEKHISSKQVKAEIIESFKSRNGIQVISTVKSLHEGFDYAGIRLSIKASYDSSKVARIQKDGRPSRLDYQDLDKNALIVNLYIKDSQEEKWLRANQRGLTGVKWVDSIDKINTELNIFDV